MHAHITYAILTLATKVGGIRSATASVDPITSMRHRAAAFMARIVETEALHALDMN